MKCPRCGTRLESPASECQACGLPMTLPHGGDRVATSGPVLEPEVLESLDAAGTERPQGSVRSAGCTLGPGCGCLGLPLAVLAGVVISSLLALLWVLSLGRLPASLVRLAARLRQGVDRA